MFQYPEWGPDPNVENSWSTELSKIEVKDDLTSVIINQ